MRITTKNKALEDLLCRGETDVKRYKKLSQTVISGFLRACETFKREKTIEGLLQYGGLHYKRLKGDLKDFESVRCDKRFRLIFKSSNIEDEIELVEIELIEITDHYAKI